MRPHRATLGLPMPAAEWFEFSSFSPSAGIRFPAIKHRYSITSSARASSVGGSRGAHRRSRNGTFYGMSAGFLVSLLGTDVSLPDHLGPFLSFLSDELAEI